MKIISKNKKIIFTITSIILILSLLCLLFIFVYPYPLNFGIKDTKAIENNVVYVDNGEEIPYLYKRDANGEFSNEDFQIMTLTDLHLDSRFTRKDRNQKTIDMMKKNIETEKPDMIIMTGDIITSSFTKSRVKKLAEMMEKYQIYWAIVYGNHDTEDRTAMSREDLTDMLSEYKYCLVKNGDVSGSGNYIINIKTAENKVSQSLIFIDSGDYMSKEDIKKYDLDKKETLYDYIKPDQIEWYKNSCTTIKNVYGENTKSMLFFHIALPEYADAYENGTLLYGDMREDPGCSKHNSGMYDAIKEMNCTHAMFVGHDHVNDFDILYENIHFVYCQPSGYSSYDMVTKFDTDENSRIQGVTLINIKENGTFSLQQKFNTRFS